MQNQPSTHCTSKKVNSFNTHFNNKHTYSYGNKYSVVIVATFKIPQSIWYTDCKRYGLEHIHTISDDDSS